ncbi:MAG: type II secretion system F family protein [Anaerolineae bacterium]|nr:type II secretion system F family protein [Anaerolineae bacterium]
MDFNNILSNLSVLWSPGIFAILCAVAVLFVWFALAPSRSKKAQDGRLDQYRQARDPIEEAELSRSFWSRAIAPAIRGFFKFLSRFTPGYNIEKLRTKLTHAGEPARLTPTDILGMQILLAVFFVIAYIAVLRFSGQLAGQSLFVLARNSGAFFVVGYIIPRIWLHMLVNRRHDEIITTFSDALDLLSVSVQAGLGFDSALVKVSEQWSNALTDEFNRANLEMRVGTPRNLALQRMADRTGVQEVQTFVGVLIQSSELGVSIAEVLKVQAEEVRLRRRQRAEELAREASIKMVFALVFLIFPALLVVLLGPAVPSIAEALGVMTGG